MVDYLRNSTVRHLTNLRGRPKLEMQPLIPQERLTRLVAMHVSTLNCHTPLI